MLSPIAGRFITNCLAFFCLVMLTACPQVAANQPPVISTFTASNSQGNVPLNATFTWQVSDPNNDVLICLLDTNNDGVANYTVNNCQTNNSQANTYSTAGSYTAKLTVRDGHSGEAVSTTSIVANQGTQPNNTVVGTGAYSIELRFASGFPSKYAPLFVSAATTWTKVITADLIDANTVNDPATNCGLSGFPNTPASKVDDLLIFASVVPIDGPGNVLGRAGPCYTRNASGLPIYGVMEFDSADMANLPASENLSTILHEMGHVIGIGTIWDAPSKNLVTGAGAYSGSTYVCGTDPRFIGTNAVNEWHVLGGTGNVPLENGGGQGTCEGHWREKTFSNELMTGYTNGSTEPLSRLTIASLQDVGYSVDYNQAEAYVLPTPITLSLQSVATERRVKLLQPLGTLP